MVKCGERLSDRDSPHGDKNDEQAIARYVGISIGGAKSERTCLSVIDLYRKQQKSFVVDIYEALGAQGELTADQVLLEHIEELLHELPTSSQTSAIRVIGVDAPLTLPPCAIGCETGCPGYEDKCRRSEVRWMRAQYHKTRAKNSRVKHFTPYSQRPVDLYFRYKHPNDPELFQDETLGANLAPQAIRMNYLKRHLWSQKLVEVWPKLSLFYLQKALKLTKKEVLEYRHLERGAAVRGRVLDRIVELSKIFIYERDWKKFVSNTDAFDSFLCAWVAMQTDLGQVVKFKSDLPLDSGWIQIPEL